MAYIILTSMCVYVLKTILILGCVLLTLYLFFPKYEIQDIYRLNKITGQVDHYKQLKDGTWGWENP